MLIEVMVPGSCGEIAQGWRNGQPYMITCPVGFYSRAVVTDRTSVKSGFGTKARAALKTTYTYLGETPIWCDFGVSASYWKGNGSQQC